MYKRILISLDNSPADDAILDHIRPLAKMMKSQLTLIHVADGFQARHQSQLGESEEMRQDREYLEKREKELRSEGFDASAILTWGDPSQRIVEAAETAKCDLIAMGTHGHRLIGDIIYGSVATDVRHRSKIPVLLVRA